MSISVASTTTPTIHHCCSFSSTVYYQIQSKSLRFRYASKFNLYVHTPQSQASSLFSYRGYYKKRENCNRYRVIVRASRRETPYQVLGVSPSATPDQIKRAYRKLALKYHPDVNKEADAQEKFMRIKHAYNTLLSSKSKQRYDNGSRASDYSYSTAERNQSRTAKAEEDFYGLGDFFKDLQEEFRNWEASAASQGKPKSLWEELAEIGEEFVEFLEKELNIEPEEENKETFKNASFGKEEAASDGETNINKGSSSIEDNIDEIEEALAQLKRELGL